MKKCILLALAMFFLTSATAHTKEDSVKVVRLLKAGRSVEKEQRFLFYAERLKGIPYTGHTLEVHVEEGERLTVNMSDMDCTTYIENVLALMRATDKGTFAAFCDELRRIRYRDGVLDGYASRNHYFCQWVLSGERQKLVRTIDDGDAVQCIRIDYMTTNRNLYRGIRTDNKAYRLIDRYERECDDMKVRYFSREALRLSDEGKDGGRLRKAIKTGDILGLVTRKKGLDTTHLGIAVWGTDGKLHLLNASSVHKKVVLEPKTLYQYMAPKKLMLGCRVVRVL